jgi:hypothetical protein
MSLHIIFDKPNIQEFIQRSYALLDDWSEGEYFELSINDRTRKIDLKLIGGVEEGGTCPDCGERELRKRRLDNGD